MSAPLPLLLGLDLGSSQLKAGVFTPGGQMRTLHCAPTPLQREGAQRATHDPEALWAAAAGLFRAVLADLTPQERGQLACLGVSSFGESGVLVDRQGQSSGPLLAWYDDRPAAVLGRLQEALPLAQLRARTGLYPDPTYSLCKLLWAARERSLAGLCWLSVADFIVLRLTGARTMGLTQAARTLLLDLRTRRWMPELAAALDLPAGLLPPLRLPGEKVGELSVQAAALTALPAGLPVWEAAHDQPCAAAGIGAVRPGITVNACGTAETLLEALPLAELDRALAGEGLVIGPHALPGLACAMTTLRASGSTLDWILALCGGERGGGERAALLEGAAGSWADGPLFFPHLRPLSDNPLEAQLPGGVFLGLRETHGQPQVIRAVLEGLSCELARRHRALRASLGAAGRLRAVGSPTRSPLWMGLKADLLEVPIEVYEQPHASVWGAAWLAWRHLNAASGLEVEAAQPSASRVYLPGHQRRSRKLRARYDALLLAQMQVWEPLPA